MANQQAPKLCFNKDKDTGDIFYQLPQDLMDKIFGKLGGRDGNQLKLMIVLLGTKPGFRISREWILERTGLTKDSYYKARKALEEIGMLRYDEAENTLTVLIDEIIGGYASKIPSGMLETTPRVCLKNTPGYASNTTIIYNIDKTNKGIDNAQPVCTRRETEEEKERKREEYKRAQFALIDKLDEEEQRGYA